MKKIISISLAILMIIAIIPFSAFAQSTHGTAYAKMTAARDKLYSAKEAFTAAESYDFLIYLQAEGDPANYKDAYIESVKTAVEEGTGDAANYALYILCLENLGIDAHEFETATGNVNLYDIVATKGTEIYSPYLYRYVFQTTTDAQFATDCLDVMKSNYTMGSGYDYWGVSCDNNAAMGVCFAASGAADEYVADIENTIDTYKKETGYYSNSSWGLDPNVDSTGLVLDFFSFTANKAKADEAFALLKNFEVEGEDGAYYSSYNPGVYDAYGTRDALIGLIGYYKLVSVTPEKVYAKMTAARNKLYSGKEEFTAKDSYDFLTYLRADGKADAYKNGYIQSVKEAVSGDTLGDAANYALAILCLQKLGVDASKFDLGDTTVNLYEAMKAKGTAIYSPYLYRYVFEANIDETFASDCLALMNQDYSASGYNYWGYSCDNDASMGVCYAASGSEADKTAALGANLSQYKKPTGYFSNSEWGLAENVDSTGLVLYYFAYTGNKDEAYETYEMLKNFEVEGEDGAYYSSYNPGVYDAYGTRDALFGLIELYNLLAPQPHVHIYNEVSVVAPKANALGYTLHTCKCGDSYKDNFKAPTGKVTGVKCTAKTAQAERITWNKVSGATGYQAQIILNGKVVQSKALSSNLYVFTKLASGSAYKVRVRFYIKAADGKNYFSNWSAVLTSPTLPKATTLKSLASASKAFTAKWAKQAGVTGYQVQYSTNAKFSSAAVKGIKGAGKLSLKVSNLKAGTKYFVRVRTFKTIGGKNYFSTWSGAKTVKTK